MASSQQGEEQGERRWKGVDATALSIECPKCGRKLTSRRMHAEGLACDCGATLAQLAAECSRRWKPLSYLFVDTKTGEVKYVGTTSDLPRRLGEHCVSDKLSATRTTVGGGGGATGRARLRPQPAETTLKNAGVRLHVALHANEWRLWYAHKPAWNLMLPPLEYDAYRSMRLTADGGTEVVTYAPAKCEHRDAEALDLAKARMRTWATWEQTWTATTRMSRMAVDEMLGEVEMPGVGRLSASRTTAIDGRTQHEWAIARLDRSSTVSAATWPLLRQGECEKLDHFGYCRCRVPCGQRWQLVGEPEERRRQRQATWFDEWNDRYRKHGVMGTDDEEIMEKLDVVFEIEAESRRLRSKARWPELNELTKAITELRAKDFYGAESEAATKGKKITLSWRHVYPPDREVARVGRDRKGHKCRFTMSLDCPGCEEMDDENDGEMEGGDGDRAMHKWNRFSGLRTGFHLK